MREWISTEYAGSPGALASCEVVSVPEGYGTADALRAVASRITSASFVVLSGDLLTDVPVGALVAQVGAGGWGMGGEGDEGGRGGLQRGVARLAGGIEDRGKREEGGRGGKEEKGQGAVQRKVTGPHRNGVRSP